MKPLLLTLLLALHAATAARADAFVPANPPEMKPLTDHNSAAYQAAKLFRHGVNLGNYLEALPGQNWGVTCEAGEFAQMRREGFDHVRVPMGWHHYAGPAPDFRLAPEIFARADFAVTNALAARLAVLINIHHFDEFDRDPAGQTEKFIALWRQIAAHYAKFPGQLAFELDNEPTENATTALVNPVYARAIAEIRKTNPRRTIFVEPGSWGSINELKNLVLPPDDNVIVSVHCYDPFPFTHQGAPWIGNDAKTTGIRFPGPPATPLPLDPTFKASSWVTNWLRDYNAKPAAENPCSPAEFTAKFKLARAWSDYYGRPVHIGEFGCNRRVEVESRAKYIAAFRRAADELQIGWAVWDWSAEFRYWDKKKNQPMPGMREALFGKQP